MHSWEEYATSLLCDVQAPVPSDCDSELDVCTVSEGAPPVLRSSGPGHAAPSDAEMPASTEPQSSPALPRDANAAEAKQPALTGAATAVPSAEAAAELPGLPCQAVGSRQEAAAAPEQAADRMAEGTLQNGAPNHFYAPGQQAANVTGLLLATDPKDIAAITAAASHFLKITDTTRSHPPDDAASASVAMVTNGQLEQEPNQAAAVAERHTNGLSTFAAAETESRNQPPLECEQNHDRAIIESASPGIGAASEAAAIKSTFLEGMKRDLVARVKNEPLNAVQGAAAAASTSRLACTAKPPAGAAEEPGAMARPAEEATPMEIDVAPPAAVPMTIEGAYLYTLESSCPVNVFLLIMSRSELDLPQKRRLLMLANLWQLFQDSAGSCMGCVWQP